MPERYRPKMDQPLDSLDINEQVLAKAALTGDPSLAVNYVIKNGSRIVAGFDTKDTEALIQKFRQDPKGCLAPIRENLFAINEDSRNTKTENEARLKRYLDAYERLTIKLDHAAFPPNPQVVHRGVPDYIPDGLSDMGSEESTATQDRSREKIRIVKNEIFKKAEQFIFKLFSHDFTNLDSTEQKKYIIEAIAQYVYKEFPYNPGNIYDYQAGRSVGIIPYMEEQQAVCRHHALVTQVLLQTFGLTSRLLKCDVAFSNANYGPHASNLVRINTVWHLLDTTNPDKSTGTTTAFLKPLPEKNIDTNKLNYTWILPEKSRRIKRIYKSRNNMFYRINDNSKSF